MQSSDPPSATQYLYLSLPPSAAELTQLSEPPSLSQIKASQLPQPTPLSQTQPLTQAVSNHMFQTGPTESDDDVAIEWGVKRVIQKRVKRNKK